MGIKSPDGEIILPPIYERVEMPFDDRIIYYHGVSARQGREFGRCNIRQTSGTVINSSYNIIGYGVFEDSYIGIAVSLGEEAEVVCRDFDGNVTPRGYWLVDKDGNAVSERYDKICINGDEANIFASSPEDIITLTLGNSVTEKAVSELALKK